MLSSISILEHNHVKTILAKDASEHLLMTGFVPVWRREWNKARCFSVCRAAAKTNLQ